MPLILTILIAAATPSAAPAPAPAPATAVTAPPTPPGPVPTEPVDPARLAAAQKLITLVSPPESRKAMFASMMTPLSAMMRRGVEASADFQSAVAADPRVRPIFDRYLARMASRSAALLDSGMPAVFDAMSRAYARRFTLAQLADLTVFFSSPTGRYYAATAPTILSDPDIAAANQALMQDALAHSRDDVAAMKAEIDALPPVKATAKPVPPKSAT